MMIDIEDIRFAYQSDTVLDGITLGIGKGMLTSIIGPNGVGKSTLLYRMNRLVEPQHGTVLVDGKDINGYKLKELARKVGFVPYTSRDGFPLAVIDTVVMGRHPRSRIGSYREDIEAARRTLAMLGIEHLVFRPFSDLSVGQRQKVMLARGIVQKLDVLLLDVRHQMEETREAVLCPIQTSSSTLLVLSEDVPEVNKEPSWYLWKDVHNGILPLFSLFTSIDAIVRGATNARSSSFPGQIRLGRIPFRTHVFRAAMWNVLSNEVTV